MSKSPSQRPQRVSSRRRVEERKKPQVPVNVDACYQRIHDHLTDSHLEVDWDLVEDLNYLRQRLREAESG